MTKAVHLINGDTSQYKLRVLVQDRLFNHETQEYMDAWNTVSSYSLDHPGQLLTQYLHNSRRIIIEENGTL